MTKELIVAIPTTPEEFVKENVDTFIQTVRETVAAYKYPEDLSKEVNRKKVRSFASQNITKRKTAADKAGKELVANIKAKVKVIDQGRKEIRDTLDNIKTEFLKPVTEWENAEKKRKDDIKDQINSMKELGLTDEGKPLSYLKETLTLITEVEIDESFHEFQKEAQEVKDGAIMSLSKTITLVELRAREAARVKREEEERKERERKEREEKIKAEAAEKARKEAEEKAQRAAEEKERKAREEQEKIQREKIEAKLALKRAEEEKQAAIEQAKREKQEAAKRAEREKQAAIENERRRVEEEKAAKEEEERKRTANKEHRQRISSEIAADLTKHCGIDFDLAEEIVLQCRMGSIRHIKIQY
jgi:hypothetical protein